MRALIVPRSGAGPGEHWYPYLIDRVEARVVLGLVGAEVRAPRDDDAAAAGDLILVGHEDGAAKIRRLLADCDAAGVLLVAPPTEEGDWSGARRLRVLLSAHPGHEQAERLWTEQMGAEVAVRPRGKRFYGVHEVAVLINLAALAMEVAEGI
jgi:hypothetical protein